MWTYRYRGHAHGSLRIFLLLRRLRASPEAQIEGLLRVLFIRVSSMPERPGEELSSVLETTIDNDAADGL